MKSLIAVTTLVLLALMVGRGENFREFRFGNPCSF